MPGIKAVAIGRAARRSPVTRRTRRLSGLRKNSFAISVMLLVQYGLGMGVNLYARVPAADQGAGITAALGRALISQPVVLAVHAGLGLLMLVAGVSVLVRAIVARHRPAIASSAAGLAAIAAAAFSAPPSSATGRTGHRWPWPSSPVWPCCATSPTCSWSAHPPHPRVRDDHLDRYGRGGARRGHPARCYPSLCPADGNLVAVGHEYMVSKHRGGRAPPTRSGSPEGKSIR